MHVVIRVTPNAKRTHVGGRYGEGDPPVLRVRVAAPAVEGKANAAVIAAVAKAFAVPPSAVRIIAGDTSRTKTIDVDGADAATVAGLLASG